MIDKRGFRLNVGIIIANQNNQLFWGRRMGPRDAWQFPQGGVSAYETLKETMYRELKEEVGLGSEDVELLSVTHRWLYYRLPRHLRRYRQKPLCIGQKQKWFLLRLLAPEHKIDFNATDSPEFSDWRWVDYWYPLDHVIGFKHDVYQAALKEFEPILFQK